MTTVLIVDDDPDTRMLVRVVFQMAGESLVIVGEASDGDEALQIWRRLDDAPDVVVVDYRMPGLTGIEVAAAMLEERPSQRVVLYSAQLNDALSAEAAHVGISRCLAKDELHLLPALVQMAAEVA